ncbi:MAG: hypothetical protein HQM13_12300 [SAR324 cluster bacterium]|nr:hypothetical protein [SAR324 cluster bacterium]
MEETQVPLTDQEKGMLQDFVLYCRDTGFWHRKPAQESETLRVRHLEETNETLPNLQVECQEFESPRFYFDKKPSQLFAPGLTEDQQVKLKKWLGEEEDPSYLIW